MNRLFPLVLGCLLAGCGEPAGSNAAAPIRVAGLKTDAMNLHAAEQLHSNWCWAACVQSVLSTQGVEVQQSQIVQRVWGTAADLPGSPFDIADRLTGQFVNGDSEPVHLLAAVYEGMPTLPLLKLHLDAGAPLIVAVENPGNDVGHAVIITAVIYEQTDSLPIVHALVIRDPGLPGGGKREMLPEEFDRIVAHVVLTTL